MTQRFSISADQLMSMITNGQLRLVNTAENQVLGDITNRSSTPLDKKTDQQPRNVANNIEFDDFTRQLLFQSNLADRTLTTTTLTPIQSTTTLTSVQSSSTITLTPAQSTTTTLTPIQSSTTTLTTVQSSTTSRLTPGQSTTTTLTPIQSSTTSTLTPGQSTTTTLTPIQSSTTTLTTVQSTDNDQNHLNNVENCSLQDFSFTYSQSDEAEIQTNGNQNNLMQTPTGPNSNATRKRKRVQNARHNSIRKLLENGDQPSPNDGVNDSSEDELELEQLIDQLKENGLKNKERMQNEIQIYKEREKERKTIRKDVKDGKLKEDELTESQKQLYKKRKKNEKFNEDLKFRMYINVRSNAIKLFFKKTVRECLKPSNTLPISKLGLNLLCNRVFLYLYYQGITSYKDASVQVGTLFTALVSNFDQIYDDKCGGGFGYKLYFLKQMQNIRNSLASSGQLEEEDFNDGAPILDEDLPA